MKTLSEIRQELSSALRQSEDFRLEKLNLYKKGVLITVICIIASLVCFFLGSTGTLAFYVVGIILLAGAIIIFYFMASKQVKEYKTHFKSNVLKRIVETMMPTVSYNATSGIQRTDFNSSQLFSSNHNIYNSEDYFKGTHKGINFEMSELDVKRRTSNTSYSNGQSRRHTSTTHIFKGLFIMITSPKSTYSETYVLPDTAEKMFGSFGKFLQKNLGALAQKGSMIYLENHPEFEKQFVVYGTEEIETERLLSQNLIQSILDIYTLWKKLPSLAFIHNKIYVAIPYTRDMLKVSLHKSLIDNQEEIIKQFIDEIALCMSIIDELSDDLK
jgi:hypothetical protein